MSPTRQIATYLESENWPAARRVIRQELRKDPDHHWLWSRLSTVYHEERRYRLAYRYARRAIMLAPWCPLATWDYAGALDAIGRKKEAIAKWQSLLRKGAERVGRGRCGEGVTWARSMLTDCRYRIGEAYADMGQPRLALRYFEAYCRDRSRGIRSIYDLRSVRKRQKEVSAALEGGADGR